jgi:UDP-N-acetylmuramate dehydrogenase
MELKIKGKMLLDEPLSSHTSLHLGGKARYFMMAVNTKDISKAMSFARKEGLESFIMGRGSNILFSDEGFSGMVISTKGMDKININDTKVIVQSGTNLSEVINIAKESSLSGFESLVGIPGSVGGASIMNAGAFDCEIGDYIEAVKVLRDGEEVRVEDLWFDYRQSSLSDEIVVEIEFSLGKKEKREIENKIKEITELRKEKQPDFSKVIGTCGSVFKNPEGFAAGELIEKAGCKGMGIGGVRVSRKHCNYFLTTPGATSRDFIELARVVRDKVERKTGVTLELEVKIIGKEKEIQI